MKKTNETVNGVASTVSIKCTNDLQWSKYHKAKGGHGFAAEDANALHDKWHYDTLSTAVRLYTWLILLKQLR